MASVREKSESNVSWIEKNMIKQNPPPHFAICINTDDPDLLTPRSVYEVLPDENAAKSNFIRVVDNEGEDYLYPAKYFVFVEFPQTVQRTLRRVSHPYLQGVSAQERVSATSQRKAEQRTG
jgi:hypothetical protein